MAATVQIVRSFLNFTNCAQWGTLDRRVVAGSVDLARPSTGFGIVASLFGQRTSNNVFEYLMAA